MLTPFGQFVGLLWLVLGCWLTKQLSGRIGHGLGNRGVWRAVAIGASIIYGIPGAILTSLSTTDPDACINNKKASIVGVTYTLTGIIFAAMAA